MNNKPVAYMDKKGFVITNEESAKEHGFAIPLYTHPVSQYKAITNTKIEPTVVSYTHPVKEHFEDEPQAEELHEIMQSNAELTDEEIIELFEHPDDFNCIDFARAILKRAFEK